MIIIEYTKYEIIKLKNNPSQPTMLNPFHKIITVIMYIAKNTTYSITSTRVVDWRIYRSLLACVK